MDYPFVRSDIAMFDQLAGQGGTPVDAQTWRDLMLDQYSDRLGQGVSLFARQVLHRRLRRGQAASARSAPPSVRVRALLADTAQRAALARQLQPLRHAEADVTAHLFPAPAAGGTAPVPLPPRWTRYLMLLPLAFLLSCALAFTWPAMAAVAVALSLVLMATQVAYHQRMEDWQRVATALQLQLSVHAATGLPGAATAAALRSKVARPISTMIPGLAEYAEWGMLANVKHYFASRALVHNNAEALRASYLQVASLEADYALAEHLSAAPAWCWASMGGDRTVQLQGAVHPLVSEPAPLDVTMEGKGAFISGQNGIGKSTLLRTAGLNLLAARAFGFCYAAQATVPALPVVASMQSEDALENKESLYQAELRRAQELLAHREPAVYIIDEIFRGTNHLESVSAAAAVLHELAQRGLVMVSSHNVVLAPLLANSLQAWQVQSRGGKLALTPGILHDTNGIALLAERGFGSAIEERAQRVFSWLGGHMARQLTGEEALTLLEPVGQRASAAKAA